MLADCGCLCVVCSSLADAKCLVFVVGCWLLCVLSVCGVLVLRVCRFAVLLVCCVLAVV